MVESVEVLDSELCLQITDGVQILNYGWEELEYSQDFGDLGQYLKYNQNTGYQSGA
jgi:hypothetical protein